MSPPHAKLYINGEWKDSSTGATYQVKHPHTQELVSTAAAATSEDCAAAITAAEAALDNWESLTPSNRRQILLKAADVLESESYRARFREWMGKETGSMDYWCISQSIAMGAVMREAAILATQLRGETVQSEIPGTTYLIQRRAIGVIFAISPFNAPGALTIRAIGIPLVCGNTVVLKTSEVCPYSMSIIFEALHEAGLPRGVVNLIHQSREDAPKLTSEIIAHPAVRKLNFTGSDRVGKILAAEAAKYLKPCVFELGGKAPCVVLDDANLHDATRAIVAGAMMHSGQICMSTERVIVQRKISKDLISAVQALTQKMVTGSNLDTSNGKVSVGPVFSPMHANNVVKLISEAKEAGAELIQGDLKADGALVKPHLLVGIKPGMRAWEQESFGPVVGFAIVDTVDEAIKLANNTTYSLSAAIWTTSLEGLKIAGRIRASTVVMNGLTFTSEPSYGVFGLGGSTGYGKFDVDSWTDKRAIAVRPPGEKYPFVDHLL